MQNVNCWQLASPVSITNLFSPLILPQIGWRCIDSMELREVQCGAPIAAWIWAGFYKTLLYLKCQTKELSWIVLKLYDCNCLISVFFGEMYGNWEQWVSLGFITTVGPCLWTLHTVAFFLSSKSTLRPFFLKQRIGSWLIIICSYYHGNQTDVLVKPTTWAFSHSISISMDKQKYEY